MTSKTLPQEGHPIQFTAPNWDKGTPTEPPGRAQTGQKKTIRGAG